MALNRSSWSAIDGLLVAGGRGCRVAGFAEQPCDPGVGELALELRPPLGGAQVVGIAVLARHEAEAELLLLRAGDEHARANAVEHVLQRVVDLRPR